MIQLESDDFSRTNGPLGANWTVPVGWENLTIATNVVVVSSTIQDYCIEIFTGRSWGSEQGSEIQVISCGATNVIVGAGVRGTTANQAIYMGEFVGALGNSSSARINRRDSLGTQTFLATVVLTGVVNDRVRLDINGSTIKYLRNDIEILSAVDATIATGFPGIQVRSPTTPSGGVLDNWKGFGTSTPVVAVSSNKALLGVGL